MSLKRKKNLERNRNIKKLRMLYKDFTYDGIWRKVPEDIKRKLGKREAFEMHIAFIQTGMQLSKLNRILDELKMENCRHNFVEDWTLNISCEKCGLLKQEYLEKKVKKLGKQIEDERIFHKESYNNKGLVKGLI